MVRAAHPEVPLPPDDDAAIAALTPLMGQDPAVAMPVVRALMEAARAGQRQRVLGHALCHLAVLQSTAGDAVQAEASALEALSVFQGLGAPAGQAMAINTQAILKASRGDYAGALECLGRGLPLAREGGDATTLSGLLNTQGTILFDIDDPAAAAAAYEECVAQMPAEAGVLRVQGTRSNLALALARWAEQDHARGLPEADWMPRARRAVDLARQVHAVHAEPDSPLHLATLEPLALALLVSGHPEAALTVLDNEPARQAERSSTYFAVHTSQIRARALLALGRAAEAVQECERALAMAADAGTEVGVDALYLALSLAHEATGKLGAALQAHRRFHAIRARLIFDRAALLARAAVSQLELDRALRESRIDALTGLVNRRAFDERLQVLLPGVSADSPLTLMLIDIDHFKAVNDDHGHPAGDALLQRLSALLRSLCRGSEPPARLGGDEFAVLVRGQEAQARVLAERVRTALASGAREDGVTDATISIGLAAARAPCAADELLARADRALYEVKRRGRDGLAAAP